MHIVYDVIFPLFLLFGVYLIFLYLRKKFPEIENHVKDATIWLVIGVVLIHVGIWWIRPDFWNEWQSQSGFMFFQFLFGMGFYFTTGLKIKKFLYYPGLSLILLGCIGIGWNIWTAFVLNNSATDIMSPGSPKNIPKANKVTETQVIRFWRNKLPEQSALAMIRIARRESGFNQSTNDGKPYRNPKYSGHSRVGVMQIDDDSWIERATELNNNLYTLEGNLEFALWLYKKEGFTPWRQTPSNEGIFSSIASVFRKPSPSTRGAINSIPPFTFDPEAPMPACADKEVWDEAHKALIDHPFLLAVTARESGFQMYERNTDNCTPNKKQILHAKLASGGVGTAVGALQIKPENHAKLCKDASINMMTIQGHFKCGILIYDTGQGPEAWDPENKRPLEFTVTAKPGNTFSKPWKLPKTARNIIRWDGLVEVIFSREDKSTFVIRENASGEVFDTQGKKISPNIGPVTSVSYRAVGTSPVTGYINLTY